MTIQFDKIQTDASKIEKNPITGAKRESKVGKGRFDLIPYGPLFRLARHYENGAELHGDRNWEAGLPLKVYYNSAMRHLCGWLCGDNSEDHLAALAWNAFGLMHHEEAIKSGKLPLVLCDIPSRLPFLTPEQKDVITNVQLLVEALGKVASQSIVEQEDQRINHDAVQGLGIPISAGPQDDSDADWKDDVKPDAIPSETFRWGFKTNTGL